MSYWMISNRELSSIGLGATLANQVTYWIAQAGVDASVFSNWDQVSPQAFRASLLRATSAFPPPLPDGSHEDQQHLALLIHGYNNSWEGAARWYQRVADAMFQPDAGLGLAVLFSWPSKGSPAAYLPDRREAEDSARALADVLAELYDWLIGCELQAAADPSKACRAKTSIIAHSMGNYVLQKAAASVWARKNKPLLVSLVNQLLMVAADVDNDLFRAGEVVDQSDGDALANLTYRITALYSGLDQVLGLSAGLKHYGKRRLGRSGLDRSNPLPDNVWDFDCTKYFGLHRVGGFNAHGAYFDEAEVLGLMQQVLRGLDRKLITLAQRAG